MADEVAPAQDTPEAGKTGETILTDAKPTAPVEAAPPTEQNTPNANEPAKPQAAPEKYELKLPENSPLDAAAIDKIAAYAKAQGLSNEQAQSILERESEAVASFATSQQEQFKAQVGQWVSEVKSDKEIGGEAFTQNVEMAKRVVSRFGSEGFRKTLDETGLGNHPELVRVFCRIAKSMSEDQLVMPGAQTGGRKSIEEVFYGESKKS